jgi:hypothetical protein
MQNSNKRQAAKPHCGFHQEADTEKNIPTNKFRIPDLQLKVQFPSPSNPQSISPLKKKYCNKKAFHNKKKSYIW